jgi:uncharacterized protein (DUF952 family)
MTTIYKVLTHDAWRAAEASGVFEGSAHDQRDGFIHFSTAEQLAQTLQKHYSGARDLVLLFVTAEALAQDALRWEPSRGGALFPHLYAPLPSSAVSRAEPLPLDAAGAFVLPPL